MHPACIAVKVEVVENDTAGVGCNAVVRPDVPGSAVKSHINFRECGNYPGAVELHVATYLAGVFVGVVKVVPQQLKLNGVACQTGVNLQAVDAIAHRVGGAHVFEHQSVETCGKLKSIFTAAGFQIPVVSGKGGVFYPVGVGAKLHLFAGEIGHAFYHCQWGKFERRNEKIGEGVGVF